MSTSAAKGLPVAIDLLTMRVAKSHKHTELGPLPKDWRVTTVATVCDQVVDCKNRTPPVVDFGEFAVVRTPNVRSGKFIRDELRFTNENAYTEWTKRAVPQRGDVLITREAPLGEVCLVPSDINVCLGQRMMLYRPAPDKLDPSFLLFALMSSCVQTALQKQIGGSTVGHARVDDIRNLLIPLPPTLAEQEAIAEALSDADALIESLEQLIAKKHAIKQGAMQELLTGNRRLPGFSVAAGLKKTEAGLIPADWDSNRLIRFVKDHNSGIYKKRELYGSGTNIIGVSDLYDIECIDGQLFTQAPLSPQEKAKHTLNYNDLLYGESSLVKEGIARTVHVDKSGAGTAFAWHTRRYSVDQRVLNSAFLCYFLQTHHARMHMINNCIQTAITGINTVAYFSCPILVPSLAEQTAIASALSDMDVEISSLKTKLSKARQIKQGMLQQLLTGRVRLV